VILFWIEEMTTEQCNLCIDHIYKVVPVCILMKGAATATVPNFLFRERSCGKNKNTMVLVIWVDNKNY
jgi:hypothetical protein